MPKAKSHSPRDRYWSNVLMRVFNHGMISMITQEDLDLIDRGFNLSIPPGNTARVILKFQETEIRCNREKFKEKP